MGISLHAGLRVRRLAAIKGTGVGGASTQSRAAGLSWLFIRGELPVRRLIILLLLLAPVTSWGEIYRWTDANGQVHFGERPMPGAEAIDVKPQVIERDAATRQSQERLQKVLDARQQEQAASAQKQASKTAKRNQECAKLRQTMENLGRDGRYFSEGSNGERNYYSDQQVAAARSQAASLYNAQCQ
jgi:hypothetical protein